jgi:hypothetical protein
MKLNKQVRRLTGLVFFLFCCGFHTALAQGPCTSPCEFRFDIYGDTRSGDDVHRNIVSQVVSTRPALILQTGDLVLDGRDPAEWANFENIISEIRKQNIPFYPAPGNHDIKTDSKGRELKPSRENFEEHVPPPVRPGSTKSFYAFDKDDIRFIAIDTIQNLNKGSSEYKWLESELRDAQDKHKFVIPYFHIAIFNVGHHAKEPSMFNLRKVLHPLFQQYGVTLAFQGHDHNYYRTQRDGITYIISGGGGAGLYAKEHPDQGIKGDRFESQNNYTVADVFPDKIILTTYSSAAPLSKHYKKLEQLRCTINPKSQCEVVPN